MTTSEAEELAAAVERAGLTTVLDRIVDAWDDGMRLDAAIIKPLLELHLVKVSRGIVRSTARGHAVNMVHVRAVCRASFEARGPGHWRSQ